MVSSDDAGKTDGDDVHTSGVTGLNKKAVHVKDDAARRRKGGKNEMFKRHLQEQSGGWECGEHGAKPESTAIHYIILGWPLGSNHNHTNGEEALQEATDTSTKMIYEKVEVLT
uniref:50S ribosomal protein L37e n=1 Tax=Lygus hesperus TaxID=30085 RepID=A0A0A9Y4A3_LYGHE